MSERVTDHLDPATDAVTTLGDVVRAFAKWSRSPETKAAAALVGDGVRQAAEGVAKWASTPEGRDNIARWREITEGAIALHLTIAAKAEMEGKTVEEIWDEGRAIISAGPINSALTFSLEDLGNAALAAVLEGQEAHDSAVIAIACSAETRDWLARAVETHPIVDNLSREAVAQSLRAIEREDFLAAHRTLIPEIERFVVGVGVHNGHLRRVDGRVYRVADDSMVTGFYQKAQVVIDNAGSAEVQRSLEKLREHWQDHMNVARHGERLSAWSPALLTADTVFILLAFLFMPQDGLLTAPIHRNGSAP